MRRDEVSRFEIVDSNAFSALESRLFCLACSCMLNCLFNRSATTSPCSMSAFLASSLCNRVFVTSMALKLMAKTRMKPTMMEYRRALLAKYCDASSPKSSNLLAMSSRNTPSVSPSSPILSDFSRMILPTGGFRQAFQELEGGQFFRLV